MKSSPVESSAKTPAEAVHPSAGSKRSIVKPFRSFRWEGVEPKAYKTDGSTFRDIERHTLLGRTKWEQAEKMAGEPGAGEAGAPDDGGAGNGGVGNGDVDETSLPIQTRYFEVAPGGHSSLETHAHSHSVVILRGSGHVILDNELHAVSAFDVVYIAPWCLHQFLADRGETLGFLCMVEMDRDRPRLPSEEEIEAVVQDPQVRERIRR